MRRHFLCAAALAAALLAGCSTAPNPSPTETRVSERGVILPAELRGNALIVTVKGPHGPLHLLVDTGSSRTLLSPDLAAALGARREAAAGSEVEVRAADGSSTLLPAATVNRLNLGGARFDYVPVLIYDCSSLSEDLGEPIDGILGFSLFQDTVLTLDYRRARVLITPPRPPPERDDVAVLPLNPGTRIPVITVRLADRPIYAIVDSGKDIPLSLNRIVARRSDFAFGPVDGTLVHDLRGDHVQRVGRLAVDLEIGTYVVPHPVAELTEDLSTIGGGILKFFSVTFDQPRGEVRFYRPADEPIAIPPERGPGLAFARTDAYWRVIGLVPGGPAEKAGIAPGDLVTRIDGEPVAQWDRARLDALLSGASRLQLTFLAGTREYDKVVPVVDLVP